MSRTFLCFAEAPFEFRFIVLRFRLFAAAANIENVHKIKFAQLKVLNGTIGGEKSIKGKRNLSLLTRKINLNFYLVKHATAKADFQCRILHQNVQTTEPIRPTFMGNLE